MNHKFNQALGFALDRHRDQVRKGTKVPYITHPVIVSEMLAYYYPNCPELHLAGLLHDVLEDTYTSLEELTQVFGQEVANLVWAVTKPPGSQNLPSEKVARWKAQRLAMLEHLDIDNKAVLRLKAADALANLRTIQRDLQNPAIGETIWERFKVGREESLWYYQEILQRAQLGISDEPLIQEFSLTLAQITI